MVDFLLAPPNIWIVIAALFLLYVLIILQVIMRIAVILHTSPI